MRPVVDWVLEHLYVVVFVLVFLAQLIRGFFTAKKDRPPPEALPNELEEQRRVQEIQEQIRRRIAERRGEHAPEQPPVIERREPEPAPAPRRIETTQLPDPFEGPFRKVLQEIERRAQPPVVTVPHAPMVEQRNAEMERQEMLAEQMRVLEESRMLAKRRAAHLAEAQQVESQTEGALRTVARGHLLHELHDPENLRRAFVLREVLGPPVGLR